MRRATKNPKPRNPKNNREWQEAADLAEVYLKIDSAHQYGLIEGAPDIDIERCEKILKLAARRHIKPDPEALTKYLQGMRTTTGGRLVEKPR